MQIMPLPYDKVSQLSSKDLAYIQRDKRLRNFISDWPSLESIANHIEKRKNLETDRNLLVNVLREQYKNIPPNEAVIKNVGLLELSNTFCITTAHQPSLLMGPLYYVYKICSIIHLCRQLTERYPDFNFVPVFVSGTEDHDFEEINHLRLYGKTIEWKKDASGPVGRLNTENLGEVIDQVCSILGENAYGPLIREKILACQAQGQKYSDFVHRLVHSFFGDWGLIVLNMDHEKLKEKFKPFFRAEILHQESATIVENTISELEELGYKSQATPREINVFYIEDDIRERLIPNGSNFKVNETNKTFSAQEMIELIDHSSEKLSPNVVLRPIYQEYILPNLAYVGGGGELAYWIERKAQFEAFGVPFPILVRRNSGLYVDSSSLKQIGKLDLDILDFFQETDQIIKSYVQDQSSISLDISEEKQQLENLFNTIAHKARNIEKPLEKVVLAESAKQLKSLSFIEARLMKAEKQKHEIALKKIQRIKEKLFPENGLQERTDNFLGIYQKHGPSFLGFLIENFNPLNSEFLVILDSEE